MINHFIRVKNAMNRPFIRGTGEFPCNSLTFRKALLSLGQKRFQSLNTLFLNAPLLVIQLRNSLLE